MTPSKRPRSSPSSLSESTVTSLNHGSSKCTRTDSVSPGLDTWATSIADQYPLRIYIISAKLSPAFQESLIGLVEKSAAQGNRVGDRNLELTADLDCADVVVTAVHTRPRLERNVRWEVAKTKAIVNPDWLKESVNLGTIQPYGKYAALSDILDETECLRPTAKAGSPVSPERPSGQFLSFTDPEASVRDNDLIALNYLSNFSCQRASPSTCPNQALVEELDIIRRARFYEGEERSMLSYARAIAAIKAYPYRLTNHTPRGEIAKLPYLGTKLTSMVGEFIKSGKVEEAQKFLWSPRFLSLSTFNSVHGIGPHTARHLYSLGLRSVEDLEKYYEVTPIVTHEGTATQLEMVSSKEMSVDKSIKISLALRHDFRQKIPRSESEEINHVIMRELETIEAGCKSIIVGGYRRGKLESNDVDIVISHANSGDQGAGRVRDLCKSLVERLHERAYPPLTGLVTHVLNMSGYHPHNVFRTHHRDSLEKVLAVFVLPNDSAHKRTYRRVDLIFATPGVFWTAVVGWTGSVTFERDLRLWAKQAKGLKFDSSGITRRHDSKLFHPKSEREVFDLLGLAYVHPTLRNTDA